MPVQCSVPELGIGHLAVTAEARRKGVGTALIEFMELRARTLKKNAIVLNCESANSVAVNFYKSQGFGVHRDNGSFKQMIKALPFG